MKLLTIALLLLVAIVAPANADAAPLLTVNSGIETFDVDAGNIAWVGTDRKNRASVWTKTSGSAATKIHTAPIGASVSHVEMVGGRVIFDQDVTTRSGRSTTSIFELPVGGGTPAVLAQGSFEYEQGCGRAIALIDAASDGTIYWEDATRNGAACLGIGDVLTVQRRGVDGVVTEIRRSESAATGDFFNKRTLGGTVTADRIVYGGFGQITLLDRATNAQLYTATPVSGRSFLGADISPSGVLAFGDFKSTKRLQTSEAKLVTDLAAGTTQSIGKKSSRKALMVAAIPSFCGERIVRIDIEAREKSLSIGLTLLQAGGLQPRAIKNTRKHTFTAIDCDADSLYVAEQSKRRLRTVISQRPLTAG